MRAKKLNLGHQHFLQFLSWHPDDLPANRKRYKVPKGKPMPYVERAGAVIEHPHLKRPGQTCVSAINFDLPEMPREAERSYWQVQSLDPLTLSPSLLCRECGDHGFIREGKWVLA